MKEHYIWYERYRPSSLEGYIFGDPTLEENVKKYIEEQDIPHQLYVGKQGSGKSTLAKIIVNSIDCDYLYLNAGDKGNKTDIREEILPFITSMSFKTSPKIVILDEATSILPAAQVLLLNMIETYSSHARFILTGNYVERLIPPLRSRFEEYNLSPPTKKVVAKHLVNILNQEEVTYELNDVATLVHKFYPDTRKLIGEAQKYTTNNVLTLPSKIENNSDIIDKIILELSKPNKQSFRTIRQYIADGNVSDFDGFYTKLFDESSKYSPSNEGTIAIIVNESMFQSISIIDKEICFMSCIAKILETI
jgi:replication factor C small subunit